MRKFVVKLEGSGLLIDATTCERLGLRQGVYRLGFFTTRVVDTASAHHAVAAAIDHALAELRLGPLPNGTAFNPFSQPEIRVVSVRKVQWWRQTNVPTKGFTFYPDQGLSQC